MADRSKFNMVSTGTLWGCGILYVVPSLILYLGYNEDLSNLYFKTFLAYKSIEIMNYLMSVTFLYGIVSFCTFNMEMLEKIKAFQNLMRDQEGNLHTLKVIFFRMVFISLVVGMSFFADNLTTVFAINGVFMCSLIGLVWPAMLAFSRKAEFRQTDSWLIRIMDVVCGLSGLLTLALYVISG